MNTPNNTKQQKKLKKKKNTSDLQNQPHSINTINPLPTYRPNREHPVKPDPSPPRRLENGAKTTLDTNPPRIRTTMLISEFILLDLPTNGTRTRALTTRVRALLISSPKFRVCSSFESGTRVFMSAEILEAGFVMQKGREGSRREHLCLFMSE